MCDLSVIIVNWNTKEFLKNCLSSIAENPPDLPNEVIVVDNASSDGSQEMVKKDFPWAVLIENRSNLGFAKANNQGVKFSQGKYILFLNSDTRVHPDTLTGAVRFMEMHGDAGILGCKTLNASGGLQSTAFDFPSIPRMLAFVLGLNRIFKISRLKGFSKIRTADYIQGSFLMIRRDVFEEIEGFDETFFMYAEDVDLCQRAALKGWKIYYTPEITVTHFGSGSSGDSIRALENFIRSLFYLYEKHKTPRKLKWLKKTLRLGLKARILTDFSLSLLKLKPLSREVLESYRAIISLTTSKD